MATAWEQYIQNLEDWIQAVKDADKWYEKAWILVVGDVPVEQLIDALVITMPWVSPFAAGLKASSIFGKSTGLAVEKFIVSNGLQAEASFAKAAEFMKFVNTKTAFQVVGAVTKVVKKSIPYTIADVVGEITGKTAFQLAKKAIQDLITSTLSPALPKLISLKLTLLDFIQSIETAFIRLKLWQRGVAKTLAELGALNLGKLGAMVIAIQAQIDKYIIVELIKLRAELAALKLWTETSIKALELKLNQVTIQLYNGINTKLIAHLAEFNLFRLHTQARLTGLEVKALQQKGIDAAQSAQITKLDSEVKTMTQTLDKRIDTKITDSWNDKLPEPSEKEIDDIADNAALMLGWLPAEISKVYAPLLPEIMAAIGKEFNVYG